MSKEAFLRGFVKAAMSPMTQEIPIGDIPTEPQFDAHQSLPAIDPTGGNLLADPQLAALRGAPVPPPLSNPFQQALGYVKQHPIGVGAGLAGAGGLAYLLSQRNKKKDPRSLGSPAEV